MPDSHDAPTPRRNGRATLVSVIAGMVSGYAIFVLAIMVIGTAGFLWVGFREAREEFGWVVVRALAIIPCCAVLIWIAVLGARIARRRG